MPWSMTGIFRMPIHRTFATGRTRTYVAVLFNKRLRKCDRRRVRPVAKYLFQGAPTAHTSTNLTHQTNLDTPLPLQTRCYVETGRHHVALILYWLNREPESVEIQQIQSRYRTLPVLVLTLYPSSARTHSLSEYGRPLRLDLTTRISGTEGV
jgi:hypothetical protein